MKFAEENNLILCVFLSVSFVLFCFAGHRDTLVGEKKRRVEGQLEKKKKQEEGQI